MPYTTPNTVTGSDVLTAALWNLQIRDNFEAVRKPQSACVYMVDPSSASFSDGVAVSWTASLWDTEIATPSWTIGDPTKLYVRETGLYRVGVVGSAQTSVLHNTISSLPAVNVYRPSTGRNLLSSNGQLRAGISSLHYFMNIGLVSLTANESLQLTFTLINGGTMMPASAAGSQASSQMRFQIDFVGKLT